MRLVLNYVLTLGCGIVASAGIAWLVGLVFPSARTVVFIVIAAWWMWTGFRYATIRGRQG